VAGLLKRPGASNKKGKTQWVVKKPTTQIMNKINGTKKAIRSTNKKLRFKVQGRSIG